MRRQLLWLLMVTLTVTAVVHWVPSATQPLVAAVETARSPGVAAPSTNTAVIASLPSNLLRTTVEPARRDPFDETPSAAAPAPLNPVQSPTTPRPAAAPEPPVQPVPPALTYRLLGTMADPQGERVVLLSGGPNGQQVVVAAPGVQLNGGYEVSAVTVDTVRLVYPPLQAEVLIAIPPPPAADR
jgi:hypothetical protein